jgi:nucleotide-binding universal stress UspA family protein
LNWALLKDVPYPAAGIGEGGDARHSRIVPQRIKMTTVKRGYVSSNHSILAALKAELEFLDNGGYGRPFRSGWRPTLLFRDSPICPDFFRHSIRSGCSECFLTDFDSDQGNDVPGPYPCHDIILNDAGDTIAKLQRTATQPELDRAYRAWLCAVIDKIEKSEELYMQALQTTTSITFKNILFLTDFTEASEGAKAYAIALARHHGAQLYPAHAFNPVILTENSVPQLIDEAEANIRTSLNKLANSEGVQGHALLSVSSIEDALPNWIRENKIDLVVTGTHGRKGIERFLLGSTAELVFRSATCPVLTVGPHVPFDPNKAFSPKSILVPTNFGVGTDAAVRYALSLAQETKAKLTFMHVVSIDRAFQHDEYELKQSAEIRLKQLIPPDAGLWSQPQTIVEVGDPTLEVLGYTSLLQPDLIIIGLPEHKHFSTHLQAGVSYSLISSASCPVLTVRL